MCSFLIAAALAAVPAEPTPPAEVVPGVHLLRGAFVPGSQPDGNSVVLRGADGLVVVDTGRHAAHTQRVVDFARSTGLPVRAVVNTHWHLDHVSGNPALRAAFPGLEVYASDAIRGAMSGFLASYRKQLAEMIAGAGEEAAKTGFRAELARIDSGPALYPDHAVNASGRRALAGLDIEVHLERAVTDGDVWLFEPKSRVVVAGDLVTLPAPFLDTACPARWQDALGRVAAVDFARLVPGHGPALTRAQFETYRRGFGNLLACSASPRPKTDCIEGWITDMGDLVPESERAFTRTLVEYYLDAHLRSPGRTAKLCA